MKILAIFMINFLATAAVAGLIAKFAPPDAAPAPKADQEKYSRPRLIVVASLFALSGWLLIIALMTILLLFALGFMNGDSTVVAFLIVFMFVSLSYITTANFIKCHYCNRRVFVQWTADPPPYSIKYKGMSGWSSVVLQVLFKREFQCMHCGKQYYIEDVPNKSQERTE